MVASLNNYVLMLTRYIDFGNEVLNGIFISSIVMSIPLLINYLSYYVPIITRWITSLIYGKGTSVYYYYQSSASSENYSEYEEIKSLIWYLRENEKFDNIDLQKMDRQFLPYNRSYIDIEFEKQKYSILFNIRKNKNENKEAIDDSLLTGSICVTSTNGTIKDVQNFIKSIKNLHKEHQKKKTWKLQFMSYNKRRKLFSLDEQSEWGTIESPFESIVLPIETENEFMRKITLFLSSSENYAKHNIPYKKIIYLNGKPGTGKTSLAIMTARYLKRNLYTIKLNDIPSDETLSSMFCLVRNTKSIILIEEFDCCPQVTSRNITRSKSKDNIDTSKSSDKVKEDGFTLGTLLSEMDGMKPWNGEIIFITTNHMEDIDPALLRPGRCDYIINFDNMASIDICRLIHKRTNQEIPLERQSSIPDKKYSAAEIQGKIIDYMDDYDELINSICS